jgi:hypothetical protein
MVNERRTAISKATWGEGTQSSTNAVSYYDDEHRATCLIRAVGAVNEESSKRESNLRSQRSCN